MPCSATFIPEHDLLIERFYGHVTRRDVLAMYNGLFADPRLLTTRLEYCDLSQIVSTNLNGADTRRLFDILGTQYLRRLHTFTHGATVIGPEDTTKPGAYFGQLFQRSLPASVRDRTKVFAHPPEGLAWLGLTASALSQEPPSPAVKLHK